MIVPVMAISNLVLTQQIYSEETNAAHAHYREPVPLIDLHFVLTASFFKKGEYKEGKFHRQSAQQVSR